MLKVVCDTNIYISALIFGGSPEKIILLAKDGLFQVYISPAILGEIKSTLKDKFSWSDTMIKKTINHVEQFARVIDPKIKLNAVPSDSDDNIILECAVSAKATVIVTGDKDLLRFKSYEKITILNPKQFLDQHLH